MYQPTQPLLFSWIHEGEYPGGDYTFLHSNGSYVRIEDWKKRYKDTKEKPAIPFRFTVRDRTFIGHITDECLVSRITEYLQDYYGKRYTNCSAFAHFLTTGTFIECDEEQSLVVLTQDMAQYRGETIRVGDMLCVIYANDRVWRSRKVPHRKSYLRAKKKRRGTHEFTHGLPPRKRILSAKGIRELCASGLADDYHFLVCVAKDAAGPVWLAQGGRYAPGDEPSPLVFTVGNNDGYDNVVPLLALLKRRR